MAKNRSLDDIIESTFAAVTTGRPDVADVWAEIPIPFEQFVKDPEHMGFPPLSPMQLESVRAVLGDDPIKVFEEPPHHVLVALVGKGGGKDSLAALINSYMVYALLCLKSPQEYLHHGIKGEPIDILNIAISETQAKNVYFEKFKQRIINWRWLKSKKWKITHTKKDLNPVEWDAASTGRVVVTGNAMVFPGNIRAFSGHSRSASMEGLNPISSVLDEFARFRDAKGGSNADALYKMCESSGRTRFPQAWRMFLLSFPEHDGDAMMRKYDEAIEEMKLKPVPPRKLFGIRAATWEFNPTVSKADYAEDYEKNPRESARLYECKPPKQMDAFFDLTERIDPCEQDRPNAVSLNIEHFTAPTGLRTVGRSINQVLIPRKPDRIPHVAHIDLAVSNDTAGVAVGHLEEDGRVALDFLGEWMPEKDPQTKQVIIIDQDNILDIVTQLKDRCFNITTVTFDQFNSATGVQRLNKKGIQSHRLSVGLEHYKHARDLVYAHKVNWPRHAGLKRAFEKLRRDNNTLVKDPSTSKDLLDAVVGVIYNLTGLSKQNIQAMKSGIPIEEQIPFQERGNLSMDNKDGFAGGMGISVRL